MSKVSLLYIGNKLSQKGVTVTSVETLGSFLKQEGFRVFTASSQKNKVLRLLDMMWSTLRYSSKVSYVLIDTYSTRNFFFAVSVANLCRLLKVAYIPILRGGDLPSRIQKSKSQAYKLFNGAYTNVAPSPYLMQAFKADGYDNLAYIPNTIEIKNYPFKLRHQPKPKLLWVRSFAEIYNPMLAIEILEKLLNHFPEATLCMIGPDKDGSLKKCKTYATSKDLPVSFTGKLSKREWIAVSAQYDIFINTTRFDNTPVSVIEAMALGLPVISTSVGGVPYLIENEKDGLLVLSEDKDAFIRAIGELLTNPGKALMIANNARKKAERFDWQNVKQDWVKLLKQ